MAAPTFVGSSAFATNSGGGPMTAGVPSGLETNDLKHLFVYSYNAGSIPTPSGWSSLATITHPTTYGTASLFRRFHSGEAAPSLTGPGGGLYAVMTAWRGADPTQPEDVALPTPNTGESLTLTAPSVTTATADTVVAWYFAMGDDYQLGSPTNSATARFSGASYSSTTGGDAAMGGASKVITSPGASGSCSMTASGGAANDEWFGFTVAIRPIGGAPPAIVASHFFLAAC